MRKPRTHKVSLLKVQIKKRLLAFTKRFSPQVSRMPRHRSVKRNPKVVVTKDSFLEAESGRREFGGGIERQVQSLWDAAENPPGMEGLLPKHRVRARENEEVQRAKEEKYARSSRIVEWTKKDAYNLFVAFLKQKEGHAYYSMRHVELRRANETIEDFIARQNGVLEVIEDIRIFFASSRQILNDYLDKKRKEAEEKAQREANKNATTQ